MTATNQAGPNGPADTSGTDPALAEFVQQAGGRIQAEVSGIHQRIAGQVKDLRSLSEREILAIGSVLSSIVDSVQGIVAASEAELRKSTQVVEGMTESFLDRVAAEADAQAEAVQQVFQLADQIGKSMEAIDSLRQSTELLAINSQIEAARLGEQGRGFGVLAEQMRDLSKSVKETTKGVDGAINGVRKGLPEIARHTDAMNSHMKTYIDDVQQHIRNQTLEGEGESRGLDAIVELSNRALSHLSFQDPLVQRLGSIESEVGGLLPRINAIMTGSPDSDEQINSESVDDNPASGNIMLF